MTRYATAVCAIAAVLSAVHVGAQTLTGEPLIAALRAGGAVIVMRHASSPRQAPDEAAANPDHTTVERQLDAAGRTTPASRD